METTNAGLAEAIQKIQETAAQAAKPLVIQLPCDDGTGGHIDIPVIATLAKAGEVVYQSLAEAMERGSELARERRLAQAEGPDFRTGTAGLQSLDSFVAHANRFKDAGSAIWADAASRKLVSVLDYHPEGAESSARWGRHRGQYLCPLSEAWQAWGAGKALSLDQEKFSELLDSRDRELAGGKLPNGKPAPDPSWLVSFAASLEVYSTATAKRERDPNTGRLRISYNEDKGVSGDVMPPPAFLINAPVFVDGESQVLEVRLRVTVEEGAAKFHVQIHAAGDVLREAFNGLCRRVAGGTGLPVFVGTPE